MVDPVFESEDEIEEGNWKKRKNGWPEVSMDGG